MLTVCWCFAEKLGLHDPDGFLRGGVNRQKSDKDGGEEIITTVCITHQGMYNIKHTLLYKTFRAKHALTHFTDRFEITR